MNYNCAVMRVVELLGPQRLRPTIASVVESLEIGGRIAAVTAGWQERESEDDELQEHLGGRTVNLGLYRRAEQVFRHDPELFAAHRERQNRIRKLQELYRLRLAHALDAARELLARPDRSEPAEQQTEAAIEAVRKLDAEHLEHLRQIHRAFEERQRPLERPSVAQHRRELAALLEGAAAIAIAGGHVAVLLNRLRLFGLLDLLEDRPVLAWGAGAMTLADRVVVFHDSPPQGPGNAEVLDTGLAAYTGILPLPHARRRLRLDDRRRVALFSRRFAPDRCVPLDEGARLSWNRASWSVADGLHRLSKEGALVPFEDGVDG